MAEHKDWGTLIFDYGKPEVKNFLIANAVFWCEKYHIDGIRVDAVASMLYLDYSRQEGEWVPNKYGGRENLEAIVFLKEFNAELHKRFAGVITIAEESTSWLGVTYPAYLGGLDFTFKWNLGWMNDMLHYLSHKPIDRKYVHTMVPFALLYAFHENFVLELSHDEVVHGKGSLANKMPGDEWHKFANLRVLFGFMFGHPGKKLLFMGNEFGQWREWNHDKGLDWYLLEHTPHQGLQRYVRDLNHLYISEPALYADQLREQGFAWIDHHDFHNSVIVFLRRMIQGEPSQCVIFICNFIPVTHKNYRIGVPFPGQYHELLNSDDVVYGGSNVSNLDGYEAEPTPWQRQPYSLTLTLPPLSVLILKPTEISQSQRTLSVSQKSEASIPKTPGKASTKPVEKPVLPSPVVSEGIPGKGSPPPALNAGIHQRGKKAAIHDIHPVEQQDISVPGSRVAKPQGSKRAILSEKGIVRGEKKSSG
jgi:1,4-alpha-glucan branching enzyme